MAQTQNRSRNRNKTDSPSGSSGQKKTASENNTLTAKVWPHFPPYSLQLPVIIMSRIGFFGSIFEPVCLIHVPVLAELRCSLAAFDPMDFSRFLTDFCWIFLQIFADFCRFSDLFQTFAGSLLHSSRKAAQKLNFGPIEISLGALRISIRALSSTLNLVGNFHSALFYGNSNFYLPLATPQRRARAPSRRT